MSSSGSDTDAVDSQFEQAKCIVTELVAKGIKLLALDFDKAIVSVHTAGYWRQTTHKPSEHVRPCFVALIKAALESSLHVCVVTYSMQPTLIRDVLTLVLPKSDIHKIIIRGNSKEWNIQPCIADQPLGKEQHLAWICTELFNQKHVIIAAHEILLIDDDTENCELALQFGHQAFEVPEDVTLTKIQQYALDVQVKRAPLSPS